MSNVTKLKKQAAEFEQKKQFDKALSRYVQVLDELGDQVDEADVALYNRVGDLMLRQGSVGQAVDYYEKAVDLYSEGGFHNNAIALCNKILRNAPGRNSVYYKLGKISAQKGFVNDAKQNFLEYADRMQKAGQLEEAFRALREFADLCPDQDDIRLMLADQLVRKDRKTEAIEQLHLLYEKFEAEGRVREALATVERMKAIDPDVETPTVSSSAPTPRSNDLVFLDIDYDLPFSAADRESENKQTPLGKPPALDVIGRDEARDGGPGTISDSESPEHSILDTLQPEPEIINGFEGTSLGWTTEEEVDDVAPLAGLESSDFEDGSMLVEHDSGEFLLMPDAALARHDEDAPVGAEPDATEITHAPLIAEPEVSRFDHVRSLLDKHDADWSLHEEFGELLLEKGEREMALSHLDIAMQGFERDGDLASAGSVVDTMLRIEPNSVHLHRKRVEHCVRAHDRIRLVDAYLDLAECLLRGGLISQSHAVYSRVLELAPGDTRAAAGADLTKEQPPDPEPAYIEAAPVVRAEVRPEPEVAEPEVEPALPEPSRVRSKAVQPEPKVAKPAPEPRALPADSDFVNLADWLRDDDTPKSTRMVVDVAEPGPAEQADFAEMLAMFKEGVAANVDDADHESHYDLGVAYKEMGLLDEAIAQFQRALRGSEHRARTCEALGQCFMEKKQYQIALTVLTRALDEERASDDTLVGVLYLLGYGSEMVSALPEALAYYRRVFAVDIEFRDVRRRLSDIERQLT